MFVLSLDTSSVFHECSSNFDRPPLFLSSVLFNWHLKFSAYFLLLDTSWKTANLKFLSTWYLKWITQGSDIHRWGCFLCLRSAVYGKKWEVLKPHLPSKIGSHIGLNCIKKDQVLKLLHSKSKSYLHESKTAFSSFRNLFLQSFFLKYLSNTSPFLCYRHRKQLFSLFL